MKTLRSYVEGRWHTASDGFATLVDPCSEEPVARASSTGVDFAAALDHARTVGGPALRRMTVGKRAEMLAGLAAALHEARAELIELSLLNTGTTRKDAKFDIDGGTFTLSHYAGLGGEMGERRTWTSGDGLQLGRSSRFWGQHVLLPKHGAALHVNAFNFPVWGFAEKAACALLAGMPVITKPATSTALVAERAVEIALDSGVLPAGALSLICGSTGDLVDRLGGQDVLAFTGSADTALGLRSRTALLRASTRINIEADSLNAAVLAPDVEPGSETWAVFVKDVVREMTQKTGQKCTAVRRIVVPAARLDDVADALSEALSGVVTGNPRDESVSMGPLATAAQLEDAVRGVALLREEAELVLGHGERIDGVGNPPGKGFFFGPTLLRLDPGTDGDAVHRHEVFGPVATLVAYDGGAESAAARVARAGGCLVTSLYGDDLAFIGSFVAEGGPHSGRIYLGSEKVAPQLPGSGVAMPHLLHGGPGRAGGGEELAGLRGLAPYLQPVALTGDRAFVERLAGLRD